MLLLKYGLITAAIGCFARAAWLLLADAAASMRESRTADIQWRPALGPVLVGAALLMPALGIVVVPSGMAGVRVSQISGTLGGTLYPGTHVVLPLVHRVE